jgi:2-polyprenyl-6-methoxyphenol hydroxylase-like FAD-dependent oxidoreductase
LILTTAVFLFLALPTGGVTAMHDAIALANLFFTLSSSSSADITKVFEEYRAERHPVVMHAFKAAKMSSKMIEKGIVGAITLFVATNMPKWLWKKVVCQLGRFYICVPFFFLGNG